jgi:lincosamide nucleotidyltransferase A/C/D/E
MPSARLLQLLDALAAARVQVWLDGGWGVDALLGAQHREHDDVDLVVRLTDLGRLTAALEPYGFQVAEDHLPTRLVLRNGAGEQVDLHPVTFDAAGDGWQAGAARTAPTPATPQTSSRQERWTVEASRVWDLTCSSPTTAATGRGRTTCTTCAG